MTETIQLVEQHLIWPNGSRFEVIDQAAFAAKNLYNRANYILRQAFIFEDNYLDLKSVYPLLKRAADPAA